MPEVVSEISHREWDDWRLDSLTKKSIDFLLSHLHAKYGRITREMAEENFPELFADPARQAVYARLRGRMEAIKDIQEALSLEMIDLIEEKDETDGDDEKNRPQDL